MNKISDFFAKQRVSFWLMIVSDLLSFVGLTALLISNGTQNYAIDGIVGLIFAGIAAPALQAAGIVSKTKYGEKIWADAIFLLSLICIGVCFAGVFINRLPLVVDLFIVRDVYNVFGMNAFVSGVTSMLSYLIAAVLLVVASFMKHDAKERE